MDDSRFDALTRALTEARSRRGLARFLSGLAVIGPLALHGIDQTEAKGKKKKKKKKKGSAPAPPPSPPPPPSGCTGTCAGKACGADNGCGKPCQTGSCSDQKVCQSGECVVSCAAGMADCDGDGTCQTDTTTSEQHCGGCNQPCGTNQTCINGDCTNSSTCFPCAGDKVCNESTGFCTCPANRPVQCEFNSGRCSADPQTDSTRCGRHCYDCEVSYAPGYHCCNGNCVNGCGPNTSGSCLEDPCGPNCEPCSGGKGCCNLGSGTSSQCVDLIGGYCPTSAPQ